MTLDELIAGLDGLKKTHRWQELAKRSGRDYGTISRIYRGIIKDPGISLFRDLEAALQSMTEPPAKERKAAFTEKRHPENQGQFIVDRWKRRDDPANLHRDGPSDR